MTCITITTVGYGDISPVTIQGRIFAIFIVIGVCAIYLPKTLTNLIILMSKKSPYERDSYKKNAEIKHVVITGHVQLQALKTVTTELFHIDHGSQERHAVILQSEEPGNAMEMFLHDPNYSHLVKYLKGDTMAAYAMEKACLEQSGTCILLTNKNSTEPVSIDHKNILQGLAMKKYVQDKTNKNLRLCM